MFFPSLKQGNRSSSSACGSADVLEAMGVALDLQPEVGALKFGLCLKQNFKFVLFFFFSTSSLEHLQCKR